MFILCVFACVVLHELGHALMAWRFGVRTKDITLLPIGGVARLERMPDDPRQELWVALAGPAVNVLIAAVLVFVSAIIGIAFDWRGFEWTGSNLLTDLIDVNIWLVLFNVIPAFPMDGGRVLRALLAIRMDYVRATVIAARTGQALAFVFGLVGLFGNPFLVFIALFVWLGAEQEAAAAQVRSAFGGIPVQQVMLTDFKVLSPDQPIAAAAEYLLAGWQQEFPVVFGDTVLGIVTRENLVQAIGERGTGAPVRDAMQRDVQTVDSHEMLEGVVGRLRDGKLRALPVIPGTARRHSNHGKHRGVSHDPRCGYDHGRRPQSG